jgi:hypothetical protein
MARQAEADREKRAKVINAEGESLAAAALPPGDGAPAPANRRSLLATRRTAGPGTAGPHPRSRGRPTRFPELILTKENIMRRRTFDILMATAGLFLTVTLIASGGLLTWAHTFIGNEVHTQLAAQQIYFPAASSPAVAAPQFAAMRPYGGQQLTTGAQAEVYADHFIANHLKVIGGGKTYAELSAAAIAQPGNATLAGQANTVFKGETLRGLLLNAYAFGTMGTIAGIAAIAAFIAAAVMLILSGLGLIHARRTSPEANILSGHTARTPDPAITPAQGTRINGNGLAAAPGGSPSQPA